MAAANRTIGRFHLDGIPPAPRGIPQIEVTFDIDANGILNVSAKDKATGKEQNIRIEASSGLNENEIQQMVKDAESHAGEDKKKKDEITLRNETDQLIYQTEKNLKEMEDKIDPDTKGKLEAAVGRTKEAIKGTDIEEVKAARDALNAVWHEAAQKIYAPAGSSSGSRPAAGSGRWQRPGPGSGFETRPTTRITVRSTPISRWWTDGRRGRCHRRPPIPSHPKHEYPEKHIVNK